MKKFLVTSFALVVLAIVGSASAKQQEPMEAGCTYQTVCQNGRCMNCSTCCFGGQCTTNCY